MDRIVFCRESYKQFQSLAHAYVKTDTEPYYGLCSEQVTIPKDKNNSYDSILNEEGIKELNRIEELVANNVFKNTFIKYKLVQGNSGTWFNDKTSLFYKSEYYSALNTFQNILVEGILQDMSDEDISSNKVLTTSPVIFYTDKWCVTRSGSLYKLEGQFEQ